MSNPLAIATVTATLRNLLTQVNSDLPDAVVTVKPPNKVRSNHDKDNQVNLFLYQIALNSAWQKKKNPSQAHHAPLALNLYYLVTTYGKNDDDILSHRLLGHVMSILHNHSVLNPEKLKVALPGNDLYEQFEPIRILPHSLSLEDLSKLCNTFQGPYGLSVAYQISVVLITSQSQTRQDSTPQFPPSDNRKSVIQEVSLP